MDTSVAPIRTEEQQERKLVAEITRKTGADSITIYDKPDMSDPANETLCVVLKYNKPWPETLTGIEILQKLLDKLK